MIHPDTEHAEAIAAYRTAKVWLAAAHRYGIEAAEPDQIRDLLADGVFVALPGDTLVIRVDPDRFTAAEFADYHERLAALLPCRFVVIAADQIAVSRGEPA